MAQRSGVSMKVTVNATVDRYVRHLCTCCNYLRKAIFCYSTATVHKYKSLSINIYLEMFVWNYISHQVPYSSDSHRHDYQRQMNYGICSFTSWKANKEELDCPEQMSNRLIQMQWSDVIKILVIKCSSLSAAL